MMWLGLDKSRWAMLPWDGSGSSSLDSGVERGSGDQRGVLAWVEGPLRLFFPFERFLGAYGSLSSGRIRMLSLLSSGHAPEFLKEILLRRSDVKANISETYS
jgi:hypothetical protein